MKNLRKIINVCLLALVSAFSINEVIAQPISNHYFGQNAWMPDTIGNYYACEEPPCFYNGKLHNNWQNIKKSKASIIRYGGIGTDQNMPTNFQYIRIIDSIRANGMEPVIQVPFFNYHYTATQAAAIVNYINVVKGKNVKYWIIANEPDLGYSFNSASQIAAYFKPFASAMKAVDPSILIVGPEISWYQKPVIEGLTTPGGPYDITGKDAAGRYYCDIITFHSYSFDGSQARSQVLTKLKSTSGFESSMIHLNARVAAANSAHNRTGAAKLKTAVTEANIGWQNPASDNLNGLGANSFVGAQFVAELMGIGLQQSLDFVNLWSVIEGNSVQTNCGYIDPSTSKKKPLYYHFQMMADNFKGTMITATDNQANVKTFSSKTSSQTVVLIMNQDLTSNLNYTVRLDNSTISSGSALKINVNSGSTQEYTDVISNQSTTLLRFDGAGNIIDKIEYKLNGHADANLPPTVTPIAPPVTTGLEPISNTPALELDVNVFPNPTAGKFTVQLNAADAKEKSYELNLFNLMGQLVYVQKSVFVGGKEEIELDPSVASGTYILSVKRDNEVVTKKILLNK